MSDLALVDWQRKPATQIRPGLPGRAAVDGALDHALRFASRNRTLIWSLAAAALACLILAVLGPVQPPATRTPHAPAAAAPAWIDIIKPLELFSLETGDLAKATKLYQARRKLSGGGRQDTIAYGTLGSDEPALRLTVYRRGGEAYVQGPIFADLARLAAEAGLSVARSGLPDLLTTRFGAFEVVAAALSAGTARAAPCEGFRLVLDAPAVTMTGLSCSGKAVALTRERLGCLLERLDLSSGGEDKSLVEFFAATELKRNVACAGMRLAPDMAHAAWLDDRSATPRKNARHR